MADDKKPLAPETVRLQEAFFQSAIHFGLGRSDRAVDTGDGSVLMELIDHHTILILSPRGRRAVRVPWAHARFVADWETCAVKGCRKSGQHVDMGDQDHVGQDGKPIKKVPGT